MRPRAVEIYVLRSRGLRNVVRVFQRCLSVDVATVRFCLNREIGTLHVVKTRFGGGGGGGATYGTIKTKNFHRSFCQLRLQTDRRILTNHFFRYGGTSNSYLSPVSDFLTRPTNWSRVSDGITLWKVALKRLPLFEIPTVINIIDEPSICLLFRPHQYWKHIPSLNATYAPRGMKSTPLTDSFTGNGL